MTVAKTIVAFRAIVGPFAGGLESLLAQTYQVGLNEVKYVINEARDVQSDSCVGGGRNCDACACCTR